MGNLFAFPIKGENTLDAFLDWMEDLTWLPSEKITLIIWDASRFLEKDLPFKARVIEMFAKRILPYWEKEVTQIMAEGKPRAFDVYFVQRHRTAEE